MEAMMNICGVTLLQNGYGEFDEFNLRKFQATHCKVDNKSDSSSNNKSSGSSSSTTTISNSSSSTSTIVADVAALNADKEQAEEGTSNEPVET